MVHLHVFLGAPSADADSGQYVWKTIEETPAFAHYPPATLDAASRRISLLYQNVIFDSFSDSAPEPEPDPYGSQQDDGDVDHPVGTTILTWDPTPAANTTGAPSFLRPTGSVYETQETVTSVGYSDVSSIARFPNFQFSLHNLTSLSSLYAVAKSGKGSRKVNMLLFAIEVQGPDTVRLKKGSDAGQDVYILKLILGDDQSSVCKLTAWRDTAEAWGGFSPTEGLKRGDVVYFENLMATWETGSAITLIASPHNRSRSEICYRTMPYTHEDNRLRPDLRLGQSDIVVSKVAALVRWFENMAGLPGA